MATLGFTDTEIAEIYLSHQKGILPSQQVLSLCSHFLSVNGLLRDRSLSCSSCRYSIFNDAYSLLEANDAFEELTIEVTK